MMKYRDSSQILANVLECTQSNIRIGELIRKTNTNHVKIKKLLGKLIETEMVVSFEKEYVITEKGRQYLDSYKKFYKLVNSFGFEL